jgi:hypothetical protein
MTTESGRLAQILQQLRGPLSVAGRARGEDRSVDALRPQVMYNVERSHDDGARAPRALSVATRVLAHEKQPRIRTSVWREQGALRLRVTSVRSETEAPVDYSDADWQSSGRGTPHRVKPVGRASRRRLIWPGRHCVAGLFLLHFCCMELPGLSGSPWE